MSGLDEILARVHRGLGLYDFDGTAIPHIILPDERFGKILEAVKGRPLAVSTDLNVLDDRMGNVFVEMVLGFSIGGFAERLIINARTSLDFFKVMESSTMYCISSPKRGSSADLLVIQLPNRQRISTALDLMRQGLANDPG